jgi:uncharacterized membrane protein
MWMLYSVLTALSFTGMFLLFKRVSLEGTSTVAYLTWIFLFSSLFFFLHIGVTKESIRLSVTTILLILAAGVLSYVGNILQFKAIAAAPNPGYPLAIVSSQAVLMTIASIYFFGSDFSLMKGVGVVLCVTGAMVLSLA